MVAVLLGLKGPPAASSGPALPSVAASEAAAPLLGDPGHGLEGLLENLEDAGGLTGGLQ